MKRAALFFALLGVLYIAGIIWAAEKAGELGFSFQEGDFPC